MEKYHAYLKKNSNSRTLAKLCRILTVKSNIISDSIIGKVKDPKAAISIASYVSATNDQPIFSALRFATGGPGSPLSKSGKGANFSERQLYVNFAGMLDLVSTSAKNPGGVGYITPLADVDLDKKVFKIDKELIKN
jgi:hypothetical protein